MVTASAGGAMVIVTPFCASAGVATLATSARAKARERVIGDLLSTGPDGSRIEDVAKRVPEQVHAEHDEHDSESGERGHPPRLADVDGGVAQIRAPARRGRLHAQAEEAQRRFEDDDAADV